MNPDDPKKEDLFGNLEDQMKGMQGGDKLTDAERRALKKGITSRDENALKALARQTQELMKEQNPSGLPLIFKAGNVIRTTNELGIVEDDWKVESWNKAGWVSVTKKAPKQPGDDPRPGMGRIFKKILYFNEFYQLNPPDQNCINSDFLEQYKQNPLKPGPEQG